MSHLARLGPEGIQISYTVFNKKPTVTLLKYLVYLVPNLQIGNVDIPQTLFAVILERDSGISPLLMFKSI